MALSMTTDYASDRGPPEPYLRRIAAAGFTHVHWCHHWASDFVYGRPEIAQIRRWLADCGLAVLDIHASAGEEKRWGSKREYERLAGVDLVANRLEMAAELGAGSIVLHARAREPLESQLRSLESLAPAARRLGVPIALENLPGEGFGRIDELLAAEGADVLGLCYDSGHGNIGCDSIPDLARRGSRLVALHLNDNDGSGDQHRIPFTGTVDWRRVTAAIAASSYRRCVSLELSLAAHAYDSEGAYLAACRGAGERLAAMITEARSARTP
jgi:sugar phosphate isomerase/epimerase